MRLRHLVAAAGAAGLSAAVLAVPSLAAGKTPIKLSIQTEADGFSGFVKSSKTSCHSGRKVVLYRKVSGPDKKAGSDTAQPNQDGSQWKISVSRSGSYYAVVKATSKCGGKTSKTLKSKLEDTGDGASVSQGDDDDSGPASVRITMRQGIGDYRRGVLGRVISTNPDCVTDARVTIYRRKLASDGNSVIETRAGYSTVNKTLPGGVKYKKYNFKFGLVRSGNVIAKTAGSDDCRPGRSNAVSYNRPD